MNNTIIGGNIKKYRIFKDKKQQVFAKEIGVSRIMLSRYENGHVEIKLATLQLIAEKLGINITILLEIS